MITKEKIPGGPKEIKYYRQTNDKWEKVLPIGSRVLPTPGSKDIIAGLARANMSLRVPLMRLVEHKSGALPQKRMELPVPVS